MPSQPLHSAPKHGSTSPQVIVHADSQAASACVAREISDLIRERARQGQMAVLGLATGSTPLQLYHELIRLHRQEGLSFSNVITFNLDEYCGLFAEHPQSYRHFMQENLFRHIAIPAEQTFVPDGTLAADALPAYCERWETHIASTGGIDLQVLGIGRTGHIGFNEPGSAIDSTTRMIQLDPLTRLDARAHFPDEQSVPLYAVTMGIKTILQARKIRLLAWGEAKAHIVAKALTEAISPALPASFLRQHRNTAFHLDKAAAAYIPEALCQP